MQKTRFQNNQFFFSCYWYGKLTSFPISYSAGLDHASIKMIYQVPIVGISSRTVAGKCKNLKKEINAGSKLKFIWFANFISRYYFGIYHSRPLRCWLGGSDEKVDSVGVCGVTGFGGGGNGYKLMLVYRDLWVEWSLYWNEFIISPPCITLLHTQTSHRHISRTP